MHFMILMVILMFLPVLALPVFWLLPLGLAIPIYVWSLIFSGAMFWVMRGSMKQPPSTGSESMIGKEATVTTVSKSDPMAPYQVSLEGEIWRASSQDLLEPGQEVVIIAIDGNKLTVRRK